MTIQSLERSKTLRVRGVKLGREGMSQRVLAAVADFESAGKSYKGAMYLAGRLKAIAQMAASDEYWAEQVDDGFIRELRTLPTPQDREAGENEPAFECQDCIGMKEHGCYCANMGAKAPGGAA